MTIIIKNHIDGNIFNYNFLKSFTKLDGTSNTLQKLLTRSPAVYMVTEETDGKLFTVVSLQLGKFHTYSLLGRRHWGKEGKQSTGENCTNGLYEVLRGNICITVPITVCAIKCMTQQGSTNFKVLDSKMRKKAWPKSSLRLITHTD